VVEPVDTFRRATDGMRDTTKWLVTLVPGASVATVIVQIGPALGAVSPASGAFFALIALLVATGIAILITVLLAAKVLSSYVPGYGDAVEMAAADQTSPPRRGLVGRIFRRPEPTSFSQDLGRQGVLRLYGFHGPEDFFQVTDPSKDEDHRAAATVVADFAAHRQIRKRFRRFLAVWVVMLVVVLGAGAIAEVIRQNDRAAPVSTPIPIELVPNSSGWAVLNTHGCPRTLTGMISGWAIGGDLDNPLVVLDSRQCLGTRLTWDPGWGSVVPRTPEESDNDSNNVRRRASQTQCHVNARPCLWTPEVCPPMSDQVPCPSSKGECPDPTSTECWPGVARPGNG
jgi:hypothetical protein